MEQGAVFQQAGAKPLGDPEGCRGTWGLGPLVLRSHPIVRLDPAFGLAYSGNRGIPYKSSFTAWPEQVAENAWKAALWLLGQG